MQNIFTANRYLRFARRGAALLLCAGLVVFGAKQAVAGGNSGLPSDGVNFHGFSITQQPSKAIGAPFISLDIKHGGESLAGLPDDFRTVELGAAMENMPAPGCETLVVQGFTGGANCCFGYYMLSSCKGADFAARIEPLDGSVSLAEDVPNAFRASDPAFMYYEKEAAGCTLNFNRVDSPRLERLLIAVQSGWRPDAAGEFADYYRALLNGLSKDTAPATRAVQAAYYRLMAGDNAADVRALFREELPAEYQGVAGDVFADIERAIAAFAPIQPLSLK